MSKNFSDGELKKEGAFGKNIFQTLSSAYGPFIFQISLVLFLGLLGRGLLLGNANVLGYWVDSLVGKESPLQEWKSHEIVYLLFSMALTGFFMTIIFRVTFSRLSAKAVSSIYDEVTLRTSRFPMGFFDTTPAGRIITRFSSDYGNIFRLFGGPLAEFISIIFDLIMMVILITLANPIYLIFVAFIGVMNYLVFKINQQRLRKSRRDLSASRSPSIAHFAETTQGASSIRTFRRQRSFGKKFEKLDEHYLDQKMLTTKNLMSFSIQMNSLTALLLLITGSAAYFMVEKNWATIGSVGVAFSFIALSGNTIQMFFEWLAQFEEAMIGVERMDHYMRMDIEKGARLPSSAKFATNHPVYSHQSEESLFHHRLTSEKNAKVRVEKLWFRYRQDLPWVLKDIDFEVRPGERLGIVGRTGSGKSSLIQALFYLYPVERGSISIDDQRPQLLEDDLGVDLNLYRRSIAFISQEPVLFQGTLRFNLDIDSQHADEKIWHVLSQVGLKTWVESQPQKLQMKIEERGKNLSLGERQLLCMARCLLQDAPVVIMDEATSSVDPQSEEIMIKATHEFFSDRTQIIIAHRLSTLAQCNRILWLQNGEVKALGPTHEVLPRFKSTELV